MSRKYNPVDSLSEVFSLVKKKQETTLVELTKSHETTSTWLAESFQSLKRKIGADVSVVSNSYNKRTKYESETKISTKQNSTDCKTEEVVVKSSASASSSSKLGPIDSNPSTVKLYPDEHSSHPRYLQVMAMKVIDLRRELKAMDLDGTGLKKDLQKRLLTALPNQNDTSNDKKQLPTKSEDTKLLSSKSPFVNSESQDEEMEEEDEEQANEQTNDDQMSIVVIENETPVDRMSLDNVRSKHESAPEKDAPVVAAPVKEVDVEESVPVKESVHAKEVAALEPVKMKNVAVDDKVTAEVTEVEMQKEKPMEPPVVPKSYVKSAAALFSPNPLTSKFQQPRPHDIIPSQKPKQGLSPLQSIKTTIVKTATSFISSSSSGKICSDKAEPEKKAVIAPISNTDEVHVEGNGLSTAVKVASDGNTETMMAMSMSMGIKEKQKLLAEARKQRLAEMRVKSKPVATGLSKSVKEIALASNSKLTQGKDTEKRTILNAKIREKHAAMKGQEVTSSTSKFPSKPLALHKAESFNQPVPRSPALKKAASANTILSKSPPVNKSSMTRPFGSSNFQSSTKKISVEKDTRGCSPMDTYQISDREGSDSDESDDSDAAPRKRIPKWAQKENLLTALKDQYDDNGVRLDPDILFPEVESCDLEAIFNKKRGKYKTRTSSGNWTKDKVTLAEKRKYKQTMGYKAVL